MTKKTTNNTILKTNDKPLTRGISMAGMVIINEKYDPIMVAGTTFPVQKLGKFLSTTLYPFRRISVKTERMAEIEKIIPT
ncbi:MAG: hypothetical protein R2819_12830 [Allomuricauda sp.]